MVSSRFFPLTLLITHIIFGWRLCLRVIWICSSIICTFPSSPWPPRLKYRAVSCHQMHNRCLNMILLVSHQSPLKLGDDSLLSSRQTCKHSCHSGSRINPIRYCWSMSRSAGSAVAPRDRNTGNHLVPLTHIVQSRWVLLRKLSFY